MTVALDTITDALEWIGVYAPGETISDPDAERCLSKLIDMLDQWSNENLACYAYSQQSGPLVVGQQSYTIGTSGGANFAITRPLKLMTGPGSAYSIDSSGNKYQMDVVTIEQWQLIANSSSINTSNFPDTLFYDPQFPLGILNFNPYPNQTYTAHWTSLLPFTDPTVLNSSITLPPGYKDAIQTNLAIKIWPYFLKGTPDAWRIQEAKEALGKIKRTNMRPTIATYDPALLSRTGNVWSIYIDGPPR